jgi:DNA mismatch repair protein MutL
MSIKVLAPEVISQIAAGEVVERPASVVKELVENSLDAGASRVTIEVRGSGVSLIRVSDSGVGIPAEEVELAFHRYATSKIRGLAELERVSSLGFRGEALPSIAAVAGVEIITRTAEEMEGTFLSLCNGALVGEGRRGHPPGTTVTIRNLFRDVPARLKFLKSPATENSRITNIVSQYSLAFPEVKFTLVIDGREVLHTPGNGNLRDVLAEVYGIEVAQAMLEIGESGDIINGYVSPPPISRSSRSYLSFFVNRRWVQSRPLTRAVEEAYHELLMVGRFPIAVINISLPPQDIDVNVHPAKIEVRFRQEHAVFAAVHKAVKETVVKALAPSIKPSPYAPPNDEGRTSLALSQAEPDAISPPLTSQALERSMLILRVLGQLANTYIIAEGPDGLYLIDQHAAHERVLFEKLLAQQAQRAVEVQGLLEPITIDLSARQKELLSSKGEMLTQFGFTIEPFGDRTYLLRTVPTMLGSQKAAEVVREILDSSGEESPLTKWEEKIAISLACHGAVRAGQVLAYEEMKELVRALEQVASPRTCPHGRPTMLHLSSGQLEKEFGRS